MPENLFFFCIIFYLFRFLSILSVDRSILNILFLSPPLYRYTSRYFTNQDQSSQESVLCTKCSISYIISRWVVNRVYWETSWFSAIYAGKIAFFTFGHFVGSNFEKPRTSQESVLCTKCSISYIISHRPVRGVYWETSSFSIIYAGKIEFFTFGRFVGSNFEKTKNQARVRFMYEMQHFVHNFPPARERGLPRDFFIFSHLCR